MRSQSYFQLSLWNCKLPTKRRYGVLLSISVPSSLMFDLRTCESSESNNDCSKREAPLYGRTCKQTCTPEGGAQTDNQVWQNYKNNIPMLWKRHGTLQLFSSGNRTRKQPKLRYQESILCLRFFHTLDGLRIPGGVPTVSNPRSTKLAGLGRLALRESKK